MVCLSFTSCCAERSSQERGEEGIEQTMDRIFGGILRSDVVCASCGYTSTAHDPFKDISVDILEPAVAPPRPPVVGVPKPNPVSASKTHAKANKAVTKGALLMNFAIQPQTYSRRLSAVQSFKPSSGAFVNTHATYLCVKAFLTCLARANVNRAFVYATLNMTWNANPVHHPEQGTR